MKTTEPSHEKLVFSAEPAKTPALISVTKKTHNPRHVIKAVSVTYGHNTH